MKFRSSVFFRKLAVGIVLIPAMLVAGCGGGGSAAVTGVQVAAPGAVSASVLISTDSMSEVGFVATDKQGASVIAYRQTTAGLFRYSFVSSAGETFNVLYNSSGDLVSINLNDQYLVQADTVDAAGRPVSYQLTGVDIAPARIAVVSATVPAPSIQARQATLLSMSIQALPTASLAAACPRPGNMDPNDSEGLGNVIRDYSCQVSAGVFDSQLVPIIVGRFADGLAKQSQRAGRLLTLFGDTASKIIPVARQLGQQAFETIVNGSQTAAEKLARLRAETGVHVSTELPPTLDSSATKIALVKEVMAQSAKTDERLLDNYKVDPQSGLLVYTEPVVAKPSPSPSPSPSPAPAPTPTPTPTPAPAPAPAPAPIPPKPAVGFDVAPASAGTTYTPQLCAAASTGCASLGSLFVSAADLLAAGNDVPAALAYAKLVADQFNGMIARMWQAGTIPSSATLESIFRSAIAADLATGSQDAVAKAGAALTAAGFPAAVSTDIPATTSSSGQNGSGAIYFAYALQQPEHSVPFCSTEGPTDTHGPLASIAPLPAPPANMSWDLMTPQPVTKAQCDEWASQCLARQAASLCH